MFIAGDYILIHPCDAKDTSLLGSEMLETVMPVNLSGRILFETTRDAVAKYYSLAGVAGLLIESR
jgi:hypothetical protein